MTTPNKPPFVPRLSKSRYISGRQCHLRLWNEVFAPELASAVDDAQQAVFDTGHRVGELATQRYPGGEMVAEDYRQTAEALEHTRQAMAGTATAIYEAAFEYQGVTCRIDVLVRAPDGAWDIVEVKSTGSAKETHVADLAIQTWIARGAGLKVRRAGVLTLNTKYVYQGGEYNLNALFKLHNKTEEVAGRAPQISRDVEALKSLLQAELAPDIQPGPHCHKPYDCQFFEHCTRGLPALESPLSQLPSFTKQKIAIWAAQGVHEITELPEGAGLNPLQERVRQSVTSGKVYRSPDLQTALSAPKYPIHHLDFETFMPALPRFPKTRPYQALPFQWSNHIEHEDGRLEHQEFLSTEDKDPRRACAEALIESLGTEGTIVIYSPYEKRVIKELSRDVPELKTPLRALQARFWDLHPVIKEHYYHPEFRGSFSLKSVLPALVPGMTYAGMEIGDGGTAQREYTRMLDTEDPEEKAPIKTALLEYCKQDTLALVNLRKALRELL